MLGQVVETLDRRKGLEQSFLWPPIEKSDSEAGLEEKEDKEEEVEPEVKEPSWEDQPVRDKLMTALSYLRRHYSYCFYCGTQVCPLQISKDIYLKEQAQSEQIAGSEVLAAKHQQRGNDSCLGAVKLYVCKVYDCHGNLLTSSFEDASSYHMLMMMTALKNWLLMQYANAEELAAQCPGMSDEDH